jgi:hypothetical protein
MVVVPTFSHSGSLAVFIRSKVVKGNTYYQIVEGVRTGPKVRQRIVLALGTSPDPRVAIRGWRRRLNRLRKWQVVFQNSANACVRGGCEPPAAEVRKLKDLDARIGDLESRIATLRGLIKSGKIGTTGTKSKKIGTTPKRKQDRSVGTTGREDG